MTSLWNLPTRTVIGENTFAINTDFRDVLEIFSYLSDPDLPEFIRWQIALALFYEQPVPADIQQQAMEYLVWFVNGGERSPAKPGPKLLDWQQDAALIVADVNKVAGQEIRAMPFVHWWTFLSWFNAVGEGQLSTVVAIRDKLARGKKLEDWEKTYYRDHKQKVDIKRRCSQQQIEERQRLEQLLK